MRAQAGNNGHKPISVRTQPPRRLLSVVVPCANEEQVLERTHARLTEVLRGLREPDFEIVYVDDGSTDSTQLILRKLQRTDPRVRVVRLSRNFGHQVAITAGMEHASGDAVVVIDADLQDPPEVISEFVDLWQDGGHDVVYGVRAERDGETPFKLLTAKAFYRLIARLSETKIPFDTGDFRLMDRRVVDALLAMPERDRFIRGMVSWLGFSQIGVPYHRAARLAGSTKFSVFKMLRFASDGIASFSTMPLKLASWLGFLVSGAALAGILVTLYARLFEKNWVQGWASLVIAILFLGGVQLICLGIIGEYVGRIYGESKRRPLYLVRERLGFEQDSLSAERQDLAESVQADAGQNFGRPDAGSVAVRPRLEPLRLPSPAAAPIRSALRQDRMQASASPRALK